MDRQWARLLLVGVLVVFFAIVIGGPLSEVSNDDATGTYETTSVTFQTPDGAVLGTVSGRVADTHSKRYTGLSETDSLGPDEGMVFVYEDTATRTFVMRNMSFGLDIIFVDGSGQITAIYHATAEDDRQFSASARWVIEVNRGYTDTHDVSVGDEVTGLPR